MFLNRINFNYCTELVGFFFVCAGGFLIPEYEISTLDQNNLQPSVDQRKSISFSVLINQWSLYKI